MFNTNNTTSRPNRQVEYEHMFATVISGIK